MKPDLKKAKEKFWEYNCSHFGLDHDGVRDEYILLGGGNPKMEKEWRNEFIDYWLNKIDEEELESFNHLQLSEAKEILLQLVNKQIEFKDDYIKFWYAFTLKDIATGYQVNPNDKSIAIQKAKKIFSELISKEIYLTKENRQKITEMMKEALKANTEEEYILNYSKNILKLI